MTFARTRLNLETLETRENPSSLFTETFDTLTPPQLPTGWSLWSSDGTTAFATSATRGENGSAGLLSEGGSRTSALTWHPDTFSSNTGAAVSLYVDSLVPTFVFARGNNLEQKETASYLAAVVTRGLSVKLIEVNGTTARELGAIASPGAAYLSSAWIRVSIIPTGTNVKVEITRQDTGQYLNSAGAWQNSPTSAITATTTLNPAEGKIGVGRNSLYFGQVAMDNFAALSNPPPASPPVTPPPPVVAPPAATAAPLSESFDQVATGTAPDGWNGWATDSVSWFKVGDNRSFSPGNGFTSTSHLSASAARAWLNTELPPNVEASAAIYLDSLIPAHLFIRGSNLQSSTPTYYALSISRGLDARIVKVVAGVETTLASIKSSSYFSGQWIQARLAADGDNLRVQLYRTDTRQWLAADGRWVNTEVVALNIHDSTISNGGMAGIARKASYAGSLTVDDFAVKPRPEVAVTRLDGSGNVAGDAVFRADVIGSFTRIEFLLNDELRSVFTTTPAEWTFDSTTVENGDYTLKVRAYDASGYFGEAGIDFTVANPEAPQGLVIPRHYDHIRIALLAYNGTPINNAFEQELLRNSIDLVIPNARYLQAIDGTSPKTPQLIYSNVSNLYLDLLTDWLSYADKAGVSRELAFYHVAAATPFQGASASSTPVNWFWGVYQSTGSGPAVDVTSAARGGRNFLVQFGSTGTETAFGYLEKFREMNITLSRAATPGWSGVWEYVSATDAAGNPTEWKPLTLIQDGANGLKTSGRITFDPPKDWVPAAIGEGGKSLYHVRFRVTAGTAAAGAELFTVFGRDYVNARGGQIGVIPAFDYAADLDGDGYLNDSEYAKRQAGHDARFIYESRLFYPYYGQMRFVTNPSSEAVQNWAADFHVRLLNSTPLADGIFMDNATGKVPFPGISVLESTSTFSTDSGTLMNALSLAIAPKWVLANTAGGGNHADGIVAGSAGAFEEFILRPMTANWSQVNDAAAIVARRLGTTESSYLVLDSMSTGGARTDPRTLMGTLSYYYLLADAERTFLMFFGGESPATTWTEHWTPAAAVDVGSPTEAMKVFALGLDPANQNLNYKVYAREYTNALILYKPLSYTLGKGTGTTADDTATAHQLDGVYQVVNADGTLGEHVTSVALRNGEGMILMKVG